MEAGAVNASPREWAARLNKWFDAGVAKIPDEYQAACIKHVYATITHNFYETRRDKQNRLDWVWNRDIAKYNDDMQTWEAHGISKLELLMPLYREWSIDSPKLVEIITDAEELVQHAPSYRLKTKVAYHFLRSKDISVKQFAQYLTVKQRYWSAQGINLTSLNDDLYHKAIGTVQ